MPGLPSSDDAYGGFAAGPGIDAVYDFGGAADVLDLRPWESSDVYVDAISVGTDDPNLDTLVVSAGDRGVVVYGHFAPLAFHRDENGTMEKIVFADETITSASSVRALAEGSAGDAELRAAAAEAPAPPSPATLPGPPAR